MWWIMKIFQNVSYRKMFGNLWSFRREIFINLKKIKHKFTKLQLAIICKTCDDPNNC